jgi:putative transposase
VRPRASLVVEILVLRQQLAVFKRDRPRPPLRPIDRGFWVVVSLAWSRWADALAIVKPATVIAWHRRGFARFWAWKSRRIGRPPLAPEIAELIVRMAGENPLWSRRWIANELAKLGHDVGKDAVAKYMPKPPRRPRHPPTQTWKAFLHLAGTIAIDFLTVPTVTFNVLYVFFVLSLERRCVLHVNVTAHPFAAWTVAADRGGYRRGHRAAAADPRLRCHLWQRVRRAGGRPGRPVDVDGGRSVGQELSSVSIAAPSRSRSGQEERASRARSAVVG